MTINDRDIVTIPISRSVIDRAAYTAGKKFSTTATGFINREAIVILEDIFRGDLAKLALIEYLESNGVNNIEDYDRVRTDNFLEPNNREWHFRTTRNQNLVRVEVNSSQKPRNYTIDRIINELDIKINAGNENVEILPLNHTYDIAVQLYYYDIPLRSRYYNQQQIFNNLNVSDDQIGSRVVKMLNLYTRFDNIYAYAWRSMQEVDLIRRENIALGNNAKWSFYNSNRLFWKCPIRESNTIAELINEL